MEAITAHPRKEYFLRMEDKETGELIGETGYTVLEETPVGKLVHAGYFSRKSSGGKGYMTEAFRELLRFAFEENGVCRVTTGCDPENKGSENVMIKCGMIKEADMKKKVWMHGELRDRVEYRLFKGGMGEREGTKVKGLSFQKNRVLLYCNQAVISDIIGNACF